MPWLSAIVPLAAIVLNASAASAQPPLGSASSFAVLGGPAVTCTGPGSVTGDVGVLLGTGFTNAPPCLITGALHLGDSAAAGAYAAFLMAYNKLAPLNIPSTCDPFHTLTGPLTSLVLTPGVYCVDTSAKTGLLTLNAQGDANAVWIFLVNGFLTGNSFNVQMFDGGKPCNVYWWVKAYSALTASNFLGTILAGAYITVTGGTFDGRALATAAVTLTNPNVTACQATGDGFPPGVDKCEANHDKDGDDHDKDKGKDKDHKDKDKDKDHKDNDHKDKDHESKDTKRG
jgi:Ice-binding-like